ncbi:MAG: hypothetical protein DSY91_05365 [Deltaproteobacteria bacterium]|nr:MAG: hypothetical protein DSY91_05365 [Deltaproteobacteria bacterium]
MTVLAFIIAIVALVIAVLAYQKAGGIRDLQEQAEALRFVADNLREKTADALDKLEKTLRKSEEKKEAEGKAKK